MRPKLKSDTFFIPVDDGVYIRNNEKSFALKGKTLAAWLERLAPVLDGQHDLHDLCDALPIDKRPIINNLILTLTAQGCIKDVSHEQPHTLSPAIIDTYGPAITFIDYHTDAGAYRFQRFLASPVLAISSGESLVALAHALLETGNREISLLDTGEVETNYGRIQEILTVLQAERDPELHLSFLKADNWSDKEQLKQCCAHSKLVIYFNLQGSLSSVDQLNKICRQVNVPFLPAVVSGQEIHIGPLCTPDQIGCWQCYWRRKRAAQGLPAYDQEDQNPLQDDINTTYPGKPAVGITANILAQEFFKCSTNVAWNTLENNVTILEWHQLQNVKHTLFPHPLCNVCAKSATEQPNQQQSCMEEITQLTRMHTSFPEDSSLRIEKWADENSGIFAAIDDMDYYQLPLLRSRIIIPLATTKASTLAEVNAAALDYTETRLNASRLALACYVESLADDRQAHWGTYQQFKSDALQPELFFGWQGTQTRSSSILAWTWAAKLAHTADGVYDFTPVLIPGATLAPRSRWNQQEGETLLAQDIPATGVGTSWNETLAEVLHRLSSAISSSKESSQAAKIIAQTTYSNDALCATYLNMLKILDAQIILVDCTDAFGVPRISAYLDGCPIGIASHWNTLCAIREALRVAVYFIQIRSNPGPDEQMEMSTANKSIHTDMPTLSQSFPQVTLPPSLAPEDAYGAAVTALSTSFERQGWNLVIAPTLQDPTVQSIFPCVFRVLAVQQESGEK